MEALPVILPRPLPHQIPILASASRFKLLVCGRRWSKSTLALIAAISGHGPGRCLKGAVQGGKIWYVAPSYPMAKHWWRDLKRALQGTAHFLEAELRAELPTGGAISVKSADRPDSLRGVGLDGAILDEAAFLREEVWREAIRPALSDRQGWAILASTPNGMNWFYDLFLEASHAPGIWEVWQRPTSDNPLIPPEELEQARQELGPIRFAQEYEAQFTSTTEAPFRPEHIRYIDSVPDGLSYVRFWDLATSTKLSADFTVGLKLGIDAEQNLYVADVLRGQWSWPETRRLIVQTALADGPAVTLAVEKVAFQLAAVQDLLALPELRAFTIQAVPVDKSKLARALPVAARAEAGKLFILKAHWTRAFVEELLAFPHAAHDDQVDALSGAYAMLAQAALPAPDIFF